MVDADITLSAVLGLEKTTGDAFTRETVRDAVELVREVAREVPTLRFLDVAPDVVRVLAGALGVTVSGIVIAVWNKRSEIRKYADVSRYPPDEEHDVWLHEHEVRQTLKPSVQVRVAGLPLQGMKLVFTASVSLTLHGAILVIKGGRITHVRLGDVSASGQLSAGRAKLVRRELRKWSLPGSVALGEGIRIPS